jgi:hypothetical protein
VHDVDHPPGDPIEGCTPIVTVEGLPTWVDSDQAGTFVQVDSHDPLLWRRRSQIRAVIDRLTALEQLLAH